MFDTKSSFVNFSPGSRSRRDCRLKLGKLFRQSEFDLLSPNRAENRSSFVDLWKGSSVQFKICRQIGNYKIDNLGRFFAQKYTSSKKKDLVVRQNITK